MYGSIIMTPRNDIKREATSMKINPQLWKQAKIEAIRNDLELSELVEQAKIAEREEKTRMLQESFEHFVEKKSEEIKNRRRNDYRMQRRTRQESHDSNGTIGCHGSG